MSQPRLISIQSVFKSRLDTLAHLLGKAKEQAASESACLDLRLAPDMASFGTQIAYTCNQARNFVLWTQGKPADNLDPAVTSFTQGEAYISSTKAMLASVTADDALLAGTTRVDLAPGMYAEMSGAEYVDDFLLPNFYFHLVTAYGILRSAGVPLGKRDYMRHLLPMVRHG